MINKLKYFKTTGAISGSSKHLVESIVNTIPEGTNNIIEFGIGDGCITKAIIAKITIHQKLLAIEINNSFFDSFNENFTVNADALQIEKIISENDFTNCNCIISSLPFALMKKKEVNQLLKTVSNIVKESKGTFILYQYSTLYEKEIKEMFSEVSREYTLQNLPPAFIYKCKNN
jgi:phospholipid N-methyltransferase